MNPYICVDIYLDILYLSFRYFSGCLSRYTVPVFQILCVDVYLEILYLSFRYLCGCLSRYTVPVFQILVWMFI